MVSKRLTLPTYNIYSEREECIEYEEFKYCNQWYKGKIESDLIEKRSNAESSRINAQGNIDLKKQQLTNEREKQKDLGIRRIKHVTMSLEADILLFLRSGRNLPHSICMRNIV